MRKTLTLLLVSSWISTAAFAVDGVIEINQAGLDAGGITPSDTPGVPVTISASGSYRLTGNLTSLTQAFPVIDITATDVTLDLNGFSVNVCPRLACASGFANAIDAFGIDRVTVRNGRVSGAGGDCVHLDEQSRAEDLTAINCDARGVRVGDDSLVSRVIVRNAASDGVRLGERSILQGSTISGSGGPGVSASINPLILDSSISGNDGAIELFGFDSTRRGGYRGCVITNNDGPAELQPIAGGVRDMGGNVCGSDTICP
ncbi:MAG: right-handed parallel beta-helix repeat-containing protein [Myxococcota bacterium]|nr:right-handed parallel beta-helix repeat-containing protein [Myxococcota bacterium]